MRNAVEIAQECSRKGSRGMNPLSSIPGNVPNQRIRGGSRVAPAWTSTEFTWHAVSPRSALSGRRSFPVDLFGVRGSGRPS